MVYDLLFRTEAGKIDKFHFMGGRQRPVLPPVLQTCRQLRDDAGPTYFGMPRTVLIDSKGFAGFARFFSHLRGNKKVVLQIQLGGDSRSVCGCAHGGGSSHGGHSREEDDIFKPTILQDFLQTQSFMARDLTIEVTGCDKCIDQTDRSAYERLRYLWELQAQSWIDGVPCPLPDLADKCKALWNLLDGICRYYNNVW